MAVGPKRNKNQTQKFNAKFRKVCKYHAVQHGAFYRGLYRSCMKKRRLTYYLNFNKQYKDPDDARNRKAKWLDSLVEKGQDPNKYASELTSVYRDVWSDKYDWQVFANRPERKYEEPEGVRPIENVGTGSRPWAWLHWNHVSLRGDPESSESDMDEQTVSHPPAFGRSRQEVLQSDQQTVAKIAKYLEELEEMLPVVPEAIFQQKEEVVPVPWHLRMRMDTDKKRWRWYDNEREVFLKEQPLTDRHGNSLYDDAQLEHIITPISFTPTEHPQYLIRRHRFLERRLQKAAKHYYWFGGEHILRSRMEPEWKQFYVSLRGNGRTDDLDLTSYQFVASTDSHEGIKVYIDKECSDEIEAIYNMDNIALWMREQEFKCRLIQTYLTKKVPPIMRAMCPSNSKLITSFMQRSVDRIRASMGLPSSAGPEVASSSSTAPPSGAASSSAPPTGAGKSQSRGRSQRGRGRGR